MFLNKISDCKSIVKYEYIFFKVRFMICVIHCGDPEAAFHTFSQRMTVLLHFSKFKRTEAVVQRCSVKKVFLEISQNSQENTCTRVSFLVKLQDSGLRTPFLQNTSGRLLLKEAPVQEYRFDKVAVLKPVALLKKRLHLIFTMKISKFFRTAIFKNTTE